MTHTRRRTPLRKKEETKMTSSISLQPPTAACCWKLGRRLSLSSRASSFFFVILPFSRLLCVCARPIRSDAHLSDGDTARNHARLSSVRAYARKRRGCCADLVAGPSCSLLQAKHLVAHDGGCIECPSFQSNVQLNIAAKVTIPVTFLSF